uniref:Uncharacterized protein n=1 Tax=viral metagenome TaxID=1070528 RepID=A0A6C0C9U0_9ZZZZ
MIYLKLHAMLLPRIAVVRRFAFIIQRSIESYMQRCCQELLLVKDLHLLFNDLLKVTYIILLPRFDILHSSFNDPFKVTCNIAANNQY